VKTVIDAEAIEAKTAYLAEFFQKKAPAVLAFSGGVDSSVLGAAAVRFSPKECPPAGFFAVSATTAAESIDWARKAAEEIGLELTVFESAEFSDADFLRNDRRRCYYCKRDRFSAIREMAVERVLKSGQDGRRLTFIEGSNADDLGEDRPGLAASRELGFCAPLAGAGLTKGEIRRLAANWSLSTAERPSDTCLATRLAFGLSIFPERLHRIEEGEKILRRDGFSICRLRLDEPGKARIEVPKDRTGEVEIESIIEIQKLGFDEVRLDLGGYQSGKMARLDDERKKF